MTDTAAFAKGTSEAAGLGRLMADEDRRQVASNMPERSNIPRHAEDTELAPVAMTAKVHKYRAVPPTNTPRRPHEEAAVTSKRAIAESLLDGDDILVKGIGHAPNKEEVITETVGGDDKKTGHIKGQKTRKTSRRDFSCKTNIRSERESRRKDNKGRKTHIGGYMYNFSDGRLVA